MTTIHATKQKTLHYPLIKHHSLLKAGDGWLIEPDILKPTLKIWELKNNISIDIRIPGVTKDQVDIAVKEPWVMSSSKPNPASNNEIIHVILPKGGDTHERARK